MSTQGAKAVGDNVTEPDKLTKEPLGNTPEKSVEQKDPETPGTGHKANAAVTTPANPVSTDDAKAQEPDELTRHPFQTGWTFHMDKKQKSRHLDGETYKQGLKKICSFHNVEDFYNIWSHCKKPSEMPFGTNLYLFRVDLTPAWESFPSGGHWIIKVTKNNGLIDYLWEELIFAILGEQFKTPEVVGIALSTRARHDILTIWNRDNEKSQLIRFTIGERLKTILNLHHNTTVEYKEFKQAIEDKSTTKGAKQYIYVPQG